MLTMGVEEEFFVVGEATRALVSDGRPVLARACERQRAGPVSFSSEYHLSSIESRTGVCRDLAQVRLELRALRRLLTLSAAAVGCRIVAAGTPPIADWDALLVTPKPLYAQLADRYQHVILRNSISACHVHVGIADRDLAVSVMVRCRVWLPVLLAISASSPFYRGVDTGYSSYRSRLWGLFPINGIPPAYSSWAEYDTFVQALINTDTVVDGSQVLWDLRISYRHPTLEFRIADACTTLNEAVLQAGLCRALAQTCLDEVLSASRFPQISTELITAARWNAGRYGLEGQLVDVLVGDLVPASIMVDRFLTYLRPALEAAGDWDEISALVGQLLQRGTSAQRQRVALARRRSLMEVVDLLTNESAEPEI